MQNFEFLSSTKVIFGKGTESSVGSEMRQLDKKILLHYGTSSIKKSGLYDRVIAYLKDAGVEYEELPGVKPNPRLSLIREGISVCRAKNIGAILAVGGGSVIDSAKAIAYGVRYEGDVWDFFTGKAFPQDSLPIGVLLTFPAAGSETSNSCVITNEDGWYKKGVNADISRPRFAIMNPEFAFTLPPYQVACGISDILAHIMERYFTRVANVELTDRLCEATMKTVINNARTVLEKPHDYDAWAEIMWAGSIAHNNLLGTGRIGDFASHHIEHELSAINDVAHGAGLAIVFPAWMKYVYGSAIGRFVQFAVRVWNVEQSFQQPEKTAYEGIKRLESFLGSMGLPLKLSEIGIGEKHFRHIADRCLRPADMKTGRFMELGCDDVIRILELAK